MDLYSYNSNSNSSTKSNNSNSNNIISNHHSRTRSQSSTSSSTSNPHHHKQSPPNSSFKQNNVLAAGYAAGCDGGDGVTSLDEDAYNLAYCSSNSSTASSSTALSTASSSLRLPSFVLSPEFLLRSSSSSKNTLLAQTRPSGSKLLISVHQQNKALPPRKRKLSNATRYGEDSEIDFEPPLAKRQQTTHTITVGPPAATTKNPITPIESAIVYHQQSTSSPAYHSSVSSVYTAVSSIYPASVDDITHEIDTQSTTSSVNSGLCQHHHEEDDNDDDDDEVDEEDYDDDDAEDYDNHEYTDGDEDEEEDEIVSNTTSSTVSPADDRRLVKNNNNNTINNNKKCNTEKSTVAEQQVQVISSTTSATATATATTTVLLPRHHHHGERTPGTPANATTTTTPLTKVNAFDAFANSGAADVDAAYLACMTPAAEAAPLRQCPLPALSWANAYDVWQLMCKEDEEAACLRDANMLEQHPGLQPRMRAILLDWLIEVCEVYKLHRETYYLAVDYLDRYLTVQKKVQKTHLQLIGITCLFVAAKVEEIYPPKIGEFAYVTDGACQESDILQHEILLLQALEWNISPVTPMAWLGVYMQLNVNNRTPASLYKVSKDAAEVRQSASTSKRKPQSSSSLDASEAVDDAFIYPQFSGLEFVQTAQLLDLCSMDLGIANYPYSVIAAAAMSHTFNKETALRVSGLDWETIAPCAVWMEPFFHVVCEEAKHLHLMEQNEQLNSKCGLGHICPNIVTDDSHIIQTHTVTMEMFERAWLLQEQYHHTLAAKIKQEASPATGLKCPAGLLTPPASDRKPLNTVHEEDESTTTTTAVTAVTTSSTSSKSYGGKTFIVVGAAVLAADSCSNGSSSSSD